MNIFFISTVGKILGDVEVEALVETLPITQAEVEAETFSHTLGDVETVALVGTSHHTLAKVEAKTHFIADTWRYTGQSALVIVTCRHSG